MGVLKAVLFVGFGGGIGSALRYLASEVVNKYFDGVFPLATFTVNMVGCFLIGLFLSLFHQQEQNNAELSFLFIAGFCGGFTTFSAFAHENYSLIQEGHITTMFMYVGLSMLLSLVAVWLGFIVIKP